jgi:succinoglycan biosynthesis transport protein ExoP
MLQTNQYRPPPADGVRLAEHVSPAELYREFRGFIGRQYPVIAFVVLLTLALAAVYAFTSPARYTSHAVIVIDTNKNQLFQQQPVFSDAPIDSTMVDTQIEILKSEKIAASVVKDLHLTEDPEFVSPRAGLVRELLDFVIGMFSFGPPDISADVTPDSGLIRTAISTFEGDLSIKRVGLTYAINIDFQSLSPDRAAQIANAVADAYVVDALDAKFQTTRRGAVWLQDRLKELREQSSNDERAVNDFKQKNGIVDSGGRLLNDQQLAELNSALIQAHAQVAEAKARLDRVMEIVQSDNPDLVRGSAATVTDSLHNEVITKLRNQYLDYAAKEADWAKRLGPKHLAVINVRNQMLELRRNILDELRRIAETYKSDYEIAKAREESVRKSLNAIVAQGQEVSSAQVTLHALESGAQTSRALYDSFLQRYMESVQQQSFPASEARLITPAARPDGKSEPKTSKILVLASLGGLMLGLGIGFLREVSDRVFRTTGQIKEHLDVDCLAVVPSIRTTGNEPILGSLLRKSAADRPTASKVADPTSSVPDEATHSTDLAHRLILPDNSLLRMALDAPFSRFAESIRALKVAVDLSRIYKANKVIGLTSSLPNEGKSTIATALAQIIAHSGGRALLVDCDLRNPSLTRKICGGAQTGLLEVISGKVELDEAIWTDPATRLSFLPAVVHGRLAHSGEILSSEAMKTLFESLRNLYEYVIVDLSPLAPIVDVHAMTHLVDSFLFVVEWGKTKIDVAEHSLTVASGVYNNLLGVVLNKTNMTRLGRYEPYRANYYHNRHYARYGYSD